MKKMNAFMLALLGSLGIISSVALVARYFRRPAVRGTAYRRAGNYGTAAVVPVGVRRPLARRRPLVIASITYGELLDDRGLTDEEITEKLMDEGLSEEEIETYKDTGELPEDLDVEEIFE